MATSAGLGGMVLLAGDLASAAGMTAALFVVNPVAAAVIALYLGIMGGFFLFFSRRYVRRQSDNLAKRIGQVYGRAMNVLRGIRELTVANGRDVALREMDVSRAEMTRTQRNLLVLSEVPRMVLEVALYAAIMVALLVVLGSGNQDAILPVVALYVVAGLRILPSLARSLGTVTQIRTGYEIGRQLGNEISEIEAQGLQEHRAAEELPETGALELARVGFAYDASGVILDNVNLVVGHGEMVGIVGPSGSGKTTLLALLLGLLAPSSGHVKYGGADIGVADATWMSKVAYVPQDIFVLDDTVLANVCLGDPAPDLPRAEIALKQAQLRDVVSALPDGLGTRLQEGGARLSVGQRQRLGIARALYRDAKILLLDEPTAALDTDTESQVIETLAALHGEVTMIVVAHRLHTLNAADRVLHLERGHLEPAR
jgi:ABC-type multidrug transport system fused ATPase/permease subunit